MPLSWYDVLLELNSAPDRRLRMTELGARAVLSRERVSRVVDELERAGLVRRERNPDDGRSLLAVITDEGRARLRAAAPTYLAGIERHFGAHLDRTRRERWRPRCSGSSRPPSSRPPSPPAPAADGGMRPGPCARRDGPAKSPGLIPPERVGTFATASRHVRRARVGTFDSARGSRRGLRHEDGQVTGRRRPGTLNRSSMQSDGGDRCGSRRPRRPRRRPSPRGARECSASCGPGRRCCSWRSACSSACRSPSR